MCSYAYGNALCPGEACHELTFYAEHFSEFFQSHTVFLFLPGVHSLKLQYYIHIDSVTNLMLLGSDNGKSRNQCIGKTGLGIFYSKAITIMHLEFSGCAADFSDDVKWHAGIGILCITDLNISNVVVTNSTGWGVLANNILGSSQFHNSTFTYNSGTGASFSGGNSFFRYNNVQCDQFTNTSLIISKSKFSHGSNRGGARSGGGILLQFHQSTYPVRVTIKDATLYDNQASVYGGNMQIEICMHYGIECVSQNVASILIERSSFSKGESQLGGGISVIFVSIGIPCDSQQLETPSKIHIFNSEILYNTASQGGSNIFIYGNSNISNSILINNSRIIGGKVMIILEGGCDSLWDIVMNTAAGGSIHTCALFTLERLLNSNGRLQIQRFLETLPVPVVEACP